MKIKYAGPRVIITQHGISFKDGKEDKYVYLAIALQILEAINTNSSDSKTYQYDTNTQRLSQDEIIHLLEKYEYNLEELVNEEKNIYEIKLKEEILHIQSIKNIHKIEKEVWINNLNSMHDYKVQRAVNKIYYMHCINDIKNIILRQSIQEVSTPFYEKYWHVLHTVQGEIENSKHSKKTRLEIVTDNNRNMIAKLILE